ncbi:MAG TPA: DUF5706 domain-containing protein [Niabella sp.]|uniref:Pycsar system effector family protein n=1 Tax=Agriterribacter sp. TaxID=2821509 RepID=UPI002C75A09E|nr:Pycsar system effector family protein [Agriterribacter sp.]HRN48399.1 DUF5706 domain-containing protein [Niabella sp.]HRO46766.1 DUF5706 domain-containing protein [Agriterribacter sp.]HUN03959.1 DUF5706 domain-containing protein [Niabella sp.]
MDGTNTLGTTSLPDKIDTLKHTMDRYDHYYDSINNKGNLFLTLNTFLLGGIITGYYSIKDTISDGCVVTFFVWIALISCLLSLGFTLWAILPYLNKQANSVNGSVINFGNVSNIPLESFKNMYANATDEKRYEDYVQQVYLLAQGLQRKFSRLKTATYLLAACFVCIIIIGIKILI